MSDKLKAHEGGGLSTTLAGVTVLGLSDLARQRLIRLRQALADYNAPAKPDTSPKVKRSSRKKPTER